MNALADGLLTRALQHVSTQERLDLSSSELASIVNSANGDLRNALQSMQFVSAGLRRRTVAPSTSRAAKGTKRALGGGGGAADSRSAAQGAALLAACGSDRDRFPDMFHAIGSIIHRPAKRAKLLAEQVAAVAQQEQRAPQHGEGGGDGSTSGSGGSSGDGGSTCHTESSVPPPLTAATVDAAWTPEGVIEVRTGEGVGGRRKGEMGADCGGGPTLAHA